uniref:D-sedoheptulose-7-phosphate isomerase n=1 Tax=uncultured organism TaxID=155900 RepID=M1PR25_9ZZZZ|nr:phosphoheptose isomerase [uncultured organism]
MTEDPIELIEDYALKGANLRNEFFSANSRNLVDIAKVVSISIIQGGKLLLFGNGGSAADCQHLAAEFVSRFQMERPSLPAIALTTDSSILTAVSNDYDFDQVFVRQINGLAEEEDVVLGISTSGNSPNVNKGLQAALQKDILTVGMTGRDGGEISNLCKYVLHVPSDNTAFIQEIHISAGHMICRLVDYFLFEAVDKLKPHV